VLQRWIQFGSITIARLLYSSGGVLFRAPLNQTCIVSLHRNPRCKALSEVDFWHVFWGEACLSYGYIYILLLRNSLIDLIRSLYLRVRWTTCPCCLMLNKITVNPKRLPSTNRCSYPAESETRPLLYFPEWISLLQKWYSKIFVIMASNQRAR